MIDEKRLIEELRFQINNCEKYGHSDIYVDLEMAKQWLRTFDKPKGRYIPRKGEYYWFVDIYGGIIESRYNTEQDEFAIKHNLVFMTKEEAIDYKWFLDQVDKYKKEFVKDKYNYCFYLDVDYKRLEIDYNQQFKYDLTYFGDGENIEEFRNVVGDERIKKYFFNQY